ncbi:MAG: hypothetical protein WBN94_09395 [Methanothrix sp.]
MVFFDGLWRAATPRRALPVRPPDFYASIARDHKLMICGSTGNYASSQTTSNPFD